LHSVVELEHHQEAVSELGQPALQISLKQWLPHFAGAPATVMLKFKNVIAGSPMLSQEFADAECDHSEPFFEDEAHPDDLIKIPLERE
jgi:hypothetical protein